MTVQCPRCSTQYRVPEARLSDPRPVFKCTRCNHVFSAGDRPAGRAPARGRDSRNLSFAFDPPAGDEPDARSGPAIADAEHEDDLTVDDEDDRFASPDDDEEPAREEPRARGTRGADARASAVPPSARRDRGDDEPAFLAESARPRAAASASADERSEPRGARRPPPARDEARRRDRDDDDLGPEVEDDEGPLLITERDRAQRAPVEPRKRAAGPRRSPLKPVAIGVGAVVAAFLVLAAILSRRPDLAFERLGAVPILGRLLGDDHLLVWRLQINGVEQSVDHIKGDRPALVVSGRVLNTTNQSLRLIEVEGRLLSDGVERKRQVVYAANQFRKTIRDLSASEVEMLLRLEPNRRFLVRPGESASFLIVFPDPPPNATEVTCRVVDARPA
ncbi:MAG TPA: zinc-ribbon domain-containing protein [Candidatus Binatia bacterium]|nr:zinc-ribbon domain-containing protein [Candidatus Binatia bacterium]